VAVGDDRLRTVSASALVRRGTIAGPGSVRPEVLEFGSDLGNPHSMSGTHSDPSGYWSGCARTIEIPPSFCRGSPSTASRRRPNAWLRAAGGTTGSCSPPPLATCCHRRTFAATSPKSANASNGSGRLRTRRRSLSVDQPERVAAFVCVFVVRSRCAERVDCRSVGAHHDAEVRRIATGFARSCRSRHRRIGRSEPNAHGVFARALPGGLLDRVSRVDVQHRSGASA
jgi:hypothetical protein